MIKMEYLVGLGQELAADNSLSSPVVIIEHRDGRGFIPLATFGAESNQQGMYELGREAARSERQNGPVQQIAVIAEGWMGNPESGIKPSADPNRQEILIVSSWVQGRAPEHVIYHLEHAETGRVELSGFAPQPDRIESPVLNEFVRGYEEAQAVLKRERARELEY